ncbi:NAD(P)/FAD-dependent oxidoreductase [Salipiger sp. 1_MG-2023]|uniref:NAD(P)/FAD-dependent oxidoreductase n=1 Tax=Salipiger sp. 1_MG-2023 TaxID=3062665 RepID=UPI0026E35CCB|nr:NAD(P)/FAD-dependent oxidoreductase [Salipiger sp. 1_MG-2023]MDO6587410.1 NAD(P)/FAD-dependent oxidoreductase [Salipiger sp. 1_MG-2023]
MTPSCDLAIIGAGPAGMSAALEAATCGLSVAVFDEQPGPGGQIYRNVLAERTAGGGKVLGSDYLAGRDLAETFMAAPIRREFRATVWQYDETGLSWTAPGGGGRITARRVLLASGAMERPVPVQGWTRPGVMTAGAAQILLKTEGAVADGAVFIGNGPLLLLVACQYLQAGVRIGAVLEASEPGAMRGALPHLGAALRNPGPLWKGAKMLARLRAAGVRHHRSVQDIVLDGDGADGALAEVRWRDRRGSHRIETAHAFLHQGVVPNMNAYMSARAAQTWDSDRLAWAPVLDEFGRTDLPWLLVAGDAGGIGGAAAAGPAGRLAALAVASDLNLLSGEEATRRAMPHAREKERALAPRSFLDKLFRPAVSVRVPQDNSVKLCRCEEVTRGTLAAAVAEGCPGPNQFKSFSRAGMGPCQGRFCGGTVQAVMADLSGREPAEIGYLRLRMPVKPVTLGDIAAADAATEI